MCEYKASPSPPVHIKLVQVSSQAVLVGTESLVATVDVDGSGTGVKNTAVAIAALDQGAVCRHHAPCVGDCRFRTEGLRFPAIMK